jgi:hypothetical protein
MKLVNGVYVAGAWVEQHTRARPMLDRLRATGIAIAHDWTVPEGDICACGEHRDKHKDGGKGACIWGEGELANDCQAFNGIGVGSDSLLSREYRLEHSALELSAVRDADVFLLLAPNTQGSCGAWVELGAALMARMLRVSEHDGTSRRPRIIVAGPKNRRALFTERADYLAPTDDDAFEYILALGRRLARLAQEQG